MSVLKKFKDFAGWSDETEENENTEQNVPYDQNVESGYSSSVSKRNISKVVNIHATTEYQVVIVRPERFEEVKSISDHLKAKTTVLLGLESANKEVGGRIVDFLAGVAYAIDGKFSMVNKYTYIIAPYNINIAGEFLDELEEKGIFF